MRDQKLYIVVDESLPLGLAAAQAVHAGFAFSREHAALTYQWLDDSQYLVVVTAHADDLAMYAEQSEMHTRWHEPDMGNALTAVALAPCAQSRVLCAQLPLLGRAVSTV